MKDIFISGSQKPYWQTSNSMQAFLVEVLCHNKLVADSSSHSFMAMYDRDWGYVLMIEYQTFRQALTFIDDILQLPIGGWEAK